MRVPSDPESIENERLAQDTERILEAFRGGRALAPLPARPRAWEGAERVVMGGFSLEKAKLVYASWRLVRLARNGAQLSGDQSLFAERIQEFERRLADFLA